MRRCLLAFALVLVTLPASADVDPLDALLARADAVAREVAQVRGLPLKRAIAREVVDRDELRARLLAMAGEEKTKRETAAEGLALARWGMIPQATDYEALLIDLLTEQVAGYYDPKTDRLTISKSAGNDPDWAELVLAHEIQHALQDQTFDLEKFEDVPPTEGDASAARRALVEGDGIALMIEVMLRRKGTGAPWADPRIATAIERSMAVPGKDAIDRAPVAIREYLIFPYRAGFSFVAALRRRQPWSAIDAAFKDPPRSTEQIIHPDRYLAGDLPVPVAFDPPAALRGFAIAHATVWGELGFSLFLRSHGIDPGIAATAAEGWGGDRAIVLARTGDRRPAKAVALARTEWDTEADAIEAHEAAVKAIDTAVAGSLLEHTPVRSRWFALDGTTSWVERQGASVVIAHGVPVWAAARLATELWTASRVVPGTPGKPGTPGTPGKPAPPTQPAKPATPATPARPR